MHRWHLGLAVLALAATAAPAEVKLPAVISDHAVLQRDTAVPVWGTAAPGEEVTVTLADQMIVTKAGDDGRWRVKFEKLTAGGPHTLTVKGTNTLTVKDVLVGEVWLCSGQSNMAMAVSGCNNFDEEKAAATHPNIRMFREASGAATEPKTGGAGKWEVCSPTTVGGFSATAYFFGRDLHKALNVPVGLINSSVGGTPIEAWVSWDAQKDMNELKPLFEQWDKSAAAFDPKKAEADYQEKLAAWKEAAQKAKDAGQKPPQAPRKPVHPTLDAHHPAVLFNGKIAPLVPYAIRGALWYQGESNANKYAPAYGAQLRSMIADWRTRWGQGEFPFAWVQLPNFHKLQTKPVEESNWVTVRDQMDRALDVPNTGMAVTLDVGEANDIHPKNKQAVGHRLALWALAGVYGQKDVVASGPVYVSHEVKGNEVVVTFRNTSGGLSAKGGELKGFAICGPDKQWVWANARIEGDRVVLTHTEVKQPTAVRYAWADNPTATLINGAGLPAAPFRTDK